MKTGTLKFSIYLTAFIAHSAVAHADMIGSSHSNQYVQMAEAATAPATVVPAAPVQPQMEVEEGTANGVDPRIGAKHKDGSEVGGRAEVAKWLKHFDLVVVIDKATQT